MTKKMERTLEFLRTREQTITYSNLASVLFGSTSGRGMGRIMKCLGDRGYHRECALVTKVNEILH